MLPHQWILSLLPSASRLNITIYQPNTPLAPSPLPPPGASSACDEIVAQFIVLSRSTKWNIVDKVPFEGDTFEPEGLVRLGSDLYMVSAGEYMERTVKYSPDGGTWIDGTDRSAGAGFAHMMVFDGRGRRIADASISEAGSLEYHNGGIEYDGTHLWATLSQYRPNTTGTLVRMDPGRLEPEVVLKVADHQGGVVRDSFGGGLLTTFNWGSREASLWPQVHSLGASPKFSTPLATVRNPAHYVDYQDCKHLGRPRYYGNVSVMICSGIANLGEGVSIGGLALVEMHTMRPLYEVPMMMTSDLGALITKNPMDVALVDGKMRFYFLPDERNSTLYIYEAAWV
ncbi:hypothetical protein BKA67DRAFT_658072 [Truncatella angustata]|uniref:Uncharacterized protein n=1 Tax=Truncatella angustata TaxID=152316 RepID=A0A9P8UK77_9PEZI|nr:uncharacterized protein BKA67DRAFT_658072 [Truncatella angustata]KAH6653729.1 hypothetical protein BKA67DRAFT_658072 [Truncatella angustata]